MSLLEINDLNIEIRRGRRVTRPVRGVSLQVRPGEIVGLVGETGSGKTLTGLAVLGLLPSGAAVTGTVRLAGEELIGARQRRLREIRGGTVAMIFQNPGTAFDPVRTIGAQFERIIRVHQRCSARAARERAAKLLQEVELTDTRRVLDAYPHQLSGGMLQRAMIALALSCGPKLLIADEATSALDVTVAQQVRRLLLRLQTNHGFGVLFVTHNLAEAYDLCDQMYVLYAGQVAEAGPTAAVFEHPAHPYTRALLAALPSPDRVGMKLAALPGSVPANVVDVRGCVFTNRCPVAVEVCHHTPAPLVSAETPGGYAAPHTTACHLAKTSGGTP
ncbi:MAG TPA: ABC transporter ATP-binding protein [Micromonosporaceae bacterium]|nr:ABC transporter ATP-binding protein [Micromonosporaceae bacterium]